MMTRLSLKTLSTLTAIIMVFELLQIVTWAAIAPGQMKVIKIVDNLNSSISYIGTWNKEFNGIYKKGSIATSSTKNSSASLTFTGSKIEWISTYGKNHGKADVYLDGQKQTTCDLYAASSTKPCTVFSKSWSSAGTHTIVVVVSGSKNVKSTGTRVDLDAIAYTAASPTITHIPKPSNTPTLTYTPRPTNTNTPMPTNTLIPTPTNTPLPTDTPTPTPYSFDNNILYKTTESLSEFQPVTLTGYQCKDVIPLVDGWIIVGETARNKVMIVNVFTGAIGKDYLLDAPPSAMDYNPATQKLIVTQDNLNIVVVIDLAKDEVRKFNMEGSALDVSFGRDNHAVALLKVNDYWNDKVIYMFDLTTGEKVASYFSQTCNYEYLACDKSTDNILVGVKGFSPSALANFTLDESNNQLILKSSLSDPGSNGEGLEISPDGKHAAFICGSGNATLYAVTDFDPTNINNSFGEWTVGPYPTSARFSSNSINLITTNGADIMVFDTNTHNLVKTISSNTSVKLVDMSKGFSKLFSVNSDNSITVYSAYREPIVSPPQKVEIPIIIIPSPTTTGTPTPTSIPVPIQMDFAGLDNGSLTWDNILGTIASDVDKNIASLSVRGISVSTTTSGTVIRKLTLPSTSVTYMDVLGASSSTSPDTLGFNPGEDIVIDFMGKSYDFVEIGITAIPENALKFDFQNASLEAYDNLGNLLTSSGVSFKGASFKISATYFQKRISKVRFVATKIPVGGLFLTYITAN